MREGGKKRVGMFDGLRPEVLISSVCIYYLCMYLGASTAVVPRGFKVNKFT